ncbi:hypothetical protein ACWV95_04420 [Streptomyces albus]
MSASATAPVRHRLGLVTTARHCFSLTGRNLLHLKANPGEIVGFVFVQPLLVIALLVCTCSAVRSPGTPRRTSSTPCRV